MFQKVSGGLAIRGDQDEEESKEEEECLPSPFYNEYRRKQCRIAMVGASGAGKTNLLINLLQSKQLGPWIKVYIYARNLEDPAYEKLQRCIDHASLISGESLQDIVTFESDPDLIPPVDSLDRNVYNICVFDDMITADKHTQARIADYFIRGRKRNATVFYLSQSFFDMMKLIRRQCNVFIFFKTYDDREINEIYKSYGSYARQALAKYIDCKGFKNLFEEATKERYSFLLLDPDCENVKLRLRKNLNQVLQ